jgi:hypothetical protein
MGKSASPKNQVTEASEHERRDGFHANANEKVSRGAWAGLLEALEPVEESERLIRECGEAKIT